MYSNTKWKGSDMTADNTPAENIEPGYRLLKITFADYICPEGKEPYYQIRARELGTGAIFSGRYWFEGDSQGAAGARATLISLNKALFGDNAQGVPYPPDIVGGIVGADVELNSKGFTRVYKYSAAPEKEVTENTDLEDQHWEGRKAEDILYKE